MTTRPVAVAVDPVLGGIHAAMTGDGDTPPVYSSSLSVMGTRAHITTVGGPPDLPLRIEKLLTHLNLLWSRFLPNSEISQLNNAPGVPRTVSPETRRLLGEMARGFSHSQGAFDPTLLPALIAEGYGSSLVTPRATTKIPDGAALRGAFSDILVDGQTVTLPRGTTLDTGGVGKGLAADMAAELARSEGALGVLVEVGGDVRVSGISPRSDRWRLGLEHPSDPSGRLGVVELDNQGLATSTVTKRRFTVGNRATHHIIDPGTLRSAESDTVQASVIAATAAEAEMWTKVAFVRGSTALLSEARKRGFHAACLLNSGVWTTSALWPATDG